MVRVPRSLSKNEGALEAIATLSVLTGQSVELEDPPTTALSLFNSLAAASGGQSEKTETSLFFHPGEQWKTVPIACEPPWTMGDMMGILCIPMSAGTIPSELSFEGPTHGVGKLGVSHIAEGLLPMLDRRGTRSYVEVEKWGKEGRALLDIRPPLQQLGNANLRVRGHVVEVRGLISHGPGQERFAEHLLEVSESVLESHGLDLPEVERHLAMGWNEAPRLFLRVEYGNIRALSERYMREGESPEQVAEDAVQALMKSPCHGGALQTLWAMPLYLSALISEDEASIFPGLAPPWKENLPELLSIFLDHAVVVAESDYTSISLPNNEGVVMDGGCDSLTICYPSRDKHEGQQ